MIIPPDKEKIFNKNPVHEKTKWRYAEPPQSYIYKNHNNFTTDIVQ